jgi:16S rRNA processing protein RimM
VTFQLPNYPITNYQLILAKKQQDQEDLEQRGPGEKSVEPRFLVIGQIGKAHGIQGEVRVVPHTDIPERFTWLETVYIGDPDPQPVAVESARLHKTFVLLKLAGYESREQVERLRGHWLQVPEEEAIPLEEGEYFLYQLIGLQLFQDTGQYLGELVDVIETQANNVFVVQRETEQLLLPDIEEVILAIDFEHRRMTVHLLPGLWPDQDT